MHWPQGSQLGQIPVDEEDEDSELASVTQAPTRKKQIENKDLDTTIIDLLEKSDRQTVELTAKVDAAMSHGSDEKQAWVDSLTRHSTLLAGLHEGGVRSRQQVPRQGRE